MRTAVSRKLLTRTVSAERLLRRAGGPRGLLRRAPGAEGPIGEPLRNDAPFRKAVGSRKVLATARTLGAPRTCVLSPGLFSRGIPGAPAASEEPGEPEPEIRAQGPSKRTRARKEDVFRKHGTPGPLPRKLLPVKVTSEPTVNGGRWSLRFTRPSLFWSDASKVDPVDRQTSRGLRRTCNYPIGNHTPLE